MGVHIVIFHIDRGSPEGLGFGAQLAHPVTLAGGDLSVTRTQPGCDTIPGHTYTG